MITSFFKQNLEVFRMKVHQIAIFYHEKVGYQFDYLKYEETQSLYGVLLQKNHVDVYGMNVNFIPLNYNNRLGYFQQTDVVSNIGAHLDKTYFSKN